MQGTVEGWGYAAVRSEKSSGGDGGGAVNGGICGGGLNK